MHIYSEEKTFRELAVGATFQFTEGNECYRKVSKSGYCEVGRHGLKKEERRQYIADIPVSRIVVKAYNDRKLCRFSDLPKGTRFFVSGDPNTRHHHWTKLNGNFVSRMTTEEILGTDVEEFEKSILHFHKDALFYRPDAMCEIVQETETPDLDRLPAPPALQEVRS